MDLGKVGVCTQTLLMQHFETPLSRRGAKKRNPSDRLTPSEQAEQSRSFDLGDGGDVI